jgi:hypothetical protein
LSIGNKFDRNKMEPCGPDDEAIAFVNRSGVNGISGFVRRVAGREPYGSGTITVALGGSALSSFVQPWSFYTAQNIDVLTPKEPMPLEVKLYYCLCIEANRFRYSTFGREANRTLKSLLLPRRESIPSAILEATVIAVAELGRDMRIAARAQ